MQEDVLYNRLIMFYKILQEFVVFNLPQEITPLNNITRGHDRRYQILLSRIDVHKFSFFPATVTDYTVKLDDLGRSRTALMDCVEIISYFTPNYYLYLTYTLTYYVSIHPKTKQPGCKKRRSQGK